MVMFLSLSERITVMRKMTVLLVLAFALVWASNAHATLVFNADFAQDGAYETSWPMKAGDVVSVDIYVSNVPEPGLFSMGFKLTYDSSKLEVVQAGTAVDTGNWPVGPYLDLIDVTGDVDEIHMAGFRLAGVAGNDIRLGTVTFRCTAEGTSEFMLLTRGESFTGFVLDCEVPGCDPNDPSLILDGDIGAGILLATIRPPVAGNINGDEVVDLADAVLALQVIAKMDHSYVHGNADANGDGKIGMEEAIYILQRVSGLR